jgi:hypothetical protein
MTAAGPNPLWREWPGRGPNQPQRFVAAWPRYQFAYPQYARISQQYVEVVAPDAATNQQARISQQYVEIIAAAPKQYSYLGAPGWTWPGAGPNRRLRFLPDPRGETATVFVANLSANFTLDNVTTTATATVLDQASAAFTLGNVTSAATVAVLDQASAAFTLDNATSAATAAVLVKLSAAFTLDNVTSAATDADIVSASAAFTLDALTSTASATVTGGTVVVNQDGGGKLPRGYSWNDFSDREWWNAFRACVLAAHRRKHPKQRSEELLALEEAFKQKVAEQEEYTAEVMRAGEALQAAAETVSEQFAMRVEMLLAAIAAEIDDEDSFLLLN